jgi:diguanylate cyclase (GGDEF)-like protein
LTGPGGPGIIQRTIMEDAASHGAAGDAGMPVLPPPRRILVVDDSAAVRNALRETLLQLPAVGEVVEAADGVDALALLAHTPVDLILSDVTMPRLDGFKFLSAVRNNPRFREVMVIMLSAHGESVDKVRGLTIGANDYVTKPFERGELQARVTVMLKMKELQEELRSKAADLARANRELERLANQDGLTALPNRRSVFARLEIEFHRARRHREPLSLLMLDIDHFKAFNDSFGHQAGDEALRAVGAALADGVRTYDCPGRYGGEEFICFLPVTSEAEAVVVAERLRRRVEALRLALPGALDGKPREAADVRVTVSVGIASWPQTPAESVGELVAAADRALYLAKARGRNRCETASGGAAVDTPPPLV